MVARTADGGQKRFTVLGRVDTAVELEYYRHGGILPAVLRGFLKRAGHERRRGKKPRSARTAHEPDSMGEVRLPAWAYWGAQTQRAVENFGISGLRIPPGLIEALGLIKRYAAEVNAELGLLDRPAPRPSCRPPTS